jgi:uncharacterized protein
VVGAVAVLASWTCLASPSIPEIPEITRPVTDLADVVSSADEAAIGREIVSHHEATGVQLAVLLVDSTHDQDIADFAQATFTSWGGGSAERDDGVLFVLAIEDRRSRLHLGYGLEPLISDGTARRMLDGLRPELQSGHYTDATRNLVRDVVARTSHLEPGVPVRAPLGALSWLWLAMILVGIAAGIAWGIVYERGQQAHASSREGMDAWRYRNTMPWTGRVRLSAAFLFRHRPVQVTFAAFAALQLLLVLLFGSGEGFAVAYSILVWMFWPIGWLFVSAPTRVRITLGVCIGVMLSLGFLIMDHGAPLSDASAIWHVAGRLLPTAVAISGIITLGIYSGPSSGSGYSSRSSSASRSSGSSSSSYSSSSSSSSSSYSGGGGSSGGGGASSSW